MNIEEKFRKFHQYVSENNIPLEAITVGDENHLICEMHYKPNVPRNIYSHTKSFMVSAVGIAVAEGKLSPEDKVADFFPDKIPTNCDERIGQIRLKHLLSMSSGFGKALLMNKDRRAGIGAPDYEAYMFSQPILDEPGTKFCYSSADSILALHMTERAVRKNMGEYLYQHILSPLGIGWPLWEFDPQGHPNGGGGMFLTCENMMKLGQLYLSEGCYRGQRILDSSWVKEVSTPKFIFDRENNPDIWSVGYGYQFWMSPYPQSYRADGAYGQVTTILPDKGLVVSIQCPENGNFDAVKKSLHEEFLMQL